MATNTNTPSNKEEVRLWVPDPNNRVVVGLEENAADNSKKFIVPRVCRVCGKSFGSGKALGGHMRIHFRNNNKRSTLLTDNDDDDVNGVHGVEEPPIVCLICRKGFRSIKSLYGHMRCHPDRDWKGIKPPNHQNNNNTNKNINLKECLTSWQMTARRGRKPRRLSDVDKHDHEAVIYLMMLAHGKGRLSEGEATGSSMKG